MNYTITKQGHPTEATSMHGGCWIWLVTGYDIVSDQYPIHVFVSRDIDRKSATKIPTDGIRFATEAKALDYGVALAHQSIDAGAAP